jgi:hypothetical protein
MRSLLTWLARLALGAVLLVAVVITGALIFAHTQWGRDELHTRVEAALQDAIGGARIGAIDGSVLGTLTLRDVELFVRRDEVVTIATVRVDVALWPLLFNTARLEAVADDVRVRLRPGSDPGNQAPSSPPSSWRVELPHFEVHRAIVEITAGTTTRTLTEIDAAGAAVIERGSLSLSGWTRGRWQDRGAELIASVAVVVDEDVRVPTALVTLGGVTIAVNDVTVDLDRPRGSVSVSGPAQAIASLVPELGLDTKDAARLGDVVTTIDLADATPTAREVSHALPTTTSLALHAAVGPTRIWAELRGDVAQSKAHGVVSVRGVDLAKLPGSELGQLGQLGQLGGNGNVFAALEGDLRRLRGTVIASGNVPGVPVHSAILAIDAPLSGTSEPATVLAFGAGEQDLRVFATGTAHRVGDAISLDADRTQVFATAQSATVADYRITGALVAQAKLAGTLHPQLAIAAGGGATGSTIVATRIADDRRACSGDAAAPCGEPPVEIGFARVPFLLVKPAGDRRMTLETRENHLYAERVARDDLAIAVVRGSLSAYLAPFELANARVSAADIRVGRTRLGTAGARIDNQGRGLLAVRAEARPPITGVEIAANAMVKPGNRTIATLGSTRVTLPSGMRWSGRGGSVVVDSQVTLRGLLLRSGEASLGVRGDFARVTDALSVRVDADRVAASAIDARYHGLAGGTLELTRRGGAWRADGTLSVAGLGIADGAAPFDPAALIDGTVRLGLARRRLRLDARASGPALGDLELAFAATGPRDPFDLAAWQRLDASAIDKATFTAMRLALPAAARLAGRPGDPALVGTLDGTLDLAPAARSGTLAVRGIDLPRLARTGPALPALDADLTLAPRDGDLAVQMTARLADIASGGATARFAIPSRPLDPVTWRRPRELVQEATAQINEVAFDPGLLARLGVGADRPYRGRGRAELTVGRHVSEARLEIALDDVTGGVLSAPVSQSLTITAGATDTQVRATWRGGDLSGAIGSVAGSLAMTLDRWISAPAAALRAQLSARWELPATPLVPMLALFGRREVTAGTLEGNADIRGTLAAPIVEDGARLVVRDLEVAPRPGGVRSSRIEKLEIKGAWDGASGRVEIEGRDASGGTLKAGAHGRPDAFVAVTGEISADRLDIAPIAAVLPSLVPLSPRVLAGAAGIVNGKLELRGGRFDGRLEITRGALPVDPIVGTVHGISGSIEIVDQSIRAKLDGKLGAGKVHLTASADDDLTTIDATLKLEKVSPIVAFRPIVTGKVQAKLFVGGPACTKEGFKHAQVCGDMTVTETEVTLPERPDTPLLDPEVPADLRVDGLAAAPSATRAASSATAPSAVSTAAVLTAAVSSSPHERPRPWLVTRVRLDDVGVEASNVVEGVAFKAQLQTPRNTAERDHLEVSLGDTVGVRGTVEIAAQHAEVFGRRYDVQPSNVEFDGTIDPRLDIEMTHEFPALSLEVAFVGRASNPALRFSSQSGSYSQDALFSFFLGGEPGGDPSSLTRRAVAGASTRVATGRLGRRISKALPIRIDTLSCEPAPSSTTGFGSCSFGRWFSRRVYLAYRQHLGADANRPSGGAEVQYHLGRGMVLEATGDRGHVDGDFLWRYRW